MSLSIVVWGIFNHILIFSLGFNEGHSKTLSVRLLRLSAIDGFWGMFVIIIDS